MASYISIIFCVVFWILHIKAQNVSFHEHYYNSWGADNFKSLHHGTRVQLSIDEDSGSGFQSKEAYGSGVFGLRIKIPNKDSLGIVTAFYLCSFVGGCSSSSANHQELDFEFLGKDDGLPYSLQTNVFVNDSGGREEKINLWFDPTADFHYYQILWNQHQVVFFVDNTPIRVFKKLAGVNFPSAALNSVVSLWNSTEWAGGGKPTNWTQGPFRAYFEGFKIDGCQTSASNDEDCYSSKYWWNWKKYWKLDWDQRKAYNNVRKKYLTYSYCSKPKRDFPECKH